MKLASIVVLVAIIVVLSFYLGRVSVPQCHSFGHEYGIDISRDSTYIYDMYDGSLSGVIPYDPESALDSVILMTNL